MAPLDSRDRRDLDGRPPEHRWEGGYRSALGGGVGCSAAAPANRGQSLSCPTPCLPAAATRLEQQQSRAELRPPQLVRKFHTPWRKHAAAVRGRPAAPTVHLAGSQAPGSGLLVQLTLALRCSALPSAPVAHALALQAPSVQDVRAANRIGRELLRFGNSTSRFSMWHTAALLSPWSLVVQVTAEREILLPPQPVPRKFASPDEEVSFVHYALGTASAALLPAAASGIRPPLCAVCWRIDLHGLHARVRCTIRV